MIPNITHLQFLVLYILKNNYLSAPELREKLLEYGIYHSGPKFYQMMRRICHGSFVRKWMVGNKSHYSITLIGETALKEVKEFYGCF